VARGQLPNAERAFQGALEALEPLVMPFERAQVELAYGQALRRGGQRRAAAAQLQAARDRFAALRAAPFLERSERELRGCGLTPARRSDFDPGKLTAQEQAVARLVAVGMSNRQVAAELFVSVKTVQFHLTHIYAKFGIGSRAELAAQFRDQPRSSHPGPEALT
jgi:DNA-binding NarL/FixJ family response regulator